MLALMLVVAAVVLFGIATVGVGAGRVNLVAAGLYLALEHISSAHA